MCKKGSRLVTHSGFIEIGSTKLHVHIHVPYLIWQYLVQFVAIIAQCYPTVGLDIIHVNVFV